jgi:hypothetical protein
MFNGQQIFMLVLGIIACFMGYSVFRSMLPLWGFLLGGWIAFTLLPSFLPGARAADMIVQIIAFVAGGLVGALISVPLYFVIIFLSGAALGMLLGVLTGALIDVGGIASVAQITALSSMSFPPMPQTGLQYMLMAIFGSIMGGMAIAFQKFMICASSSFLGAAAIITGLAGPISLSVGSAVGRSAVMLMGWMVLAFIGLFIQFRMMDEV